MVSKSALEAAKILRDKKSTEGISQDEQRRLTYAAKLSASQKLRWSPNLKFAKHRLELFPKFDWDEELILGRVLGRGEFCNIREIQGFKLQEYIMSQNHIMDHLAENSEQRGLALREEEQVGRKFLSEHCIREDGGASRYVIKMLNEERFADPDAYYSGVRDLVLEAHYLAELEHPHIIKLRGLSTQDLGDKHFFLILDRLYGTLDNRIKEWTLNEHRGKGMKRIFVMHKKGLRREKKREFLRSRLLVAHDLSSAVHFMHKNCIINRDLKPENVGFDIRGDLKLFDFGLSTEFPPDSDKPYKNLTWKTGSLLYMAPEVYLKRPYDESVDIFSFSLILWQILALKAPYPNFTCKMIVNHVMENCFRPELDATWSECMKNLIRRMWSPIPTERPTAQELKETIKIELYSINETSLEDQGEECDTLSRRSSYLQPRFMSSVGTFFD